MSDYSAVIFDFGGVFTTSPVENFAHYERAHNLPEKFIGSVIKTNHHENAWAIFERAEISADTFNDLFAEETRKAGHEISGDTIVGLLTLQIREEMVEAFQQICVAGFKTGCITNNLLKFDSAAMVADSVHAETAQNVLEKFDHVIESSKAGVRKPEPRIYEMMCTALSVSPTQCIFIDDLGINLKPAKAMGMATVKAPYGDIRPAIGEIFGLLKLAP